MSKTMAEVMAEADDKWCREVTISSSAAWANYMSAALSAAGFGLVADAGAKALEDAIDDFSVNLTVMSGPKIRAWLTSKAKSLRGEG